MSWEHPTAKEHKQLSSVWLVWTGAMCHEGWDMRWDCPAGSKAYQSYGAAVDKARGIEEHHSVRVTQHWWNGEEFMVEVVYEKNH